MKNYNQLTVHQKINLKALLLHCGFKSLSQKVHNKYFTIHPINPIFD